MYFFLNRVSLFFIVQLALTHKPLGLSELCETAHIHIHIYTQVLRSMMCLLECQSQLGWRDPTRSRDLYQFPFGGLVYRQSSSAKDFGILVRFNSYIEPRDWHN